MMTEYEKYMRSFDKDFMRFYALDPTAAPSNDIAGTDYFCVDGWREEGMIIDDPEFMMSNTADDLERYKVHVMYFTPLGTKRYKPLPVGSLVRIGLCNQIGDERLGEIKYRDTDDQPRKVIFGDIGGGRLNYVDAYIDAAQPAKMSDENLKGTCWRVSYLISDLRNMLRDYPVRTTKVFSEGMYTYKEVLEILIRTAFRPRFTPVTIRVADIPALRDNNVRMALSNATLFDAVQEVGRLIDMVSGLRWVGVENGKAIYELYYRSKIGSGKQVDMSVFDWADACTETSQRDQSAGRIISNVTNIKSTQGMRYPTRGSVRPSLVNPDGSSTKITLPSPIEQINNIRVYFKRGWDTDKITNNPYENPNSVLRDFKTPTYVGGSMDYDPFYLKQGLSISEIDVENARLKFVDGVHYFDVKLSTDINNGIGTELVTDKSGNFASKPESRYIFMYERELWNLLPQSTGEGTRPSKDKSIVYDKGSNTIDLSALSGFGTADYSNLNFAVIPQNFPNEFAEYRITYVPRVQEMTIQTPTAVARDYTAYFNQLIQTPRDITQARQMTAYGLDMEDRRLARGKIMERRRMPHTRWTELWQTMPSTRDFYLLDDDRYTVSLYDVLVKGQVVEIQSALSLWRVGKSHRVFADSERKPFTIPDQDIVATCVPLAYRLSIGKKDRGEPTWNGSRDALELQSFFNVLRPDIRTYFADAHEPVVYMTTERADGTKILANMTTHATLDLAHGYALWAGYSQPRFSHNDAEGKPVVYTLGDGTVARMTLWTQLNNPDNEWDVYARPIAVESEYIYKDPAEVLQVALQVSYVGEDDIVILRKFKEFDYLFGDMYTAELYAYVFDTVQSPDNIDLTAALESYKIKSVVRTDHDPKIEIAVNPRPDMHIVYVARGERGDDIVMIDNSPNIRDGMAIYYVYAERF